MAGNEDLLMGKKTRMIVLMLSLYTTKPLKFIMYFYMLIQSIFTTSFWDNWGKILFFTFEKTIIGGG